jgi:pyruvate formate-lyase activating enzyme-like uncharacterized protein
MSQAWSARRYYLQSACTLVIEGQEELASEVLAKRAAIAVTALGACPAKKKLALAISEELEEALERQVRLYEGLEDLQGSTEEELIEAGLSEEEAAKVLNFIG